MFDINGTPIPDPRDPTKQASLRTYPLTGNGVMDSLLHEMQQGASPNFNFFAYYSADLRDYVVETAQNRYPGNPPSWCNGAAASPQENRFALTETRLTRDAMTLCPDAFLAVSEPFETIADAINSNVAKDLGSPSTTLLRGH